MICLTLIEPNSFLTIKKIKELKEKILEKCKSFG